MAEPKVQLVAPIGNISVPGMNVTGVVTATISGNVGVAGSIVQGNNLDIGAGIITASSFVGDQIGTYRAASLTGSPDLVVGVVTSSGFVAQITGDVTGDISGNVVGTAGSVKSGNNLWVGIATGTLVGNGVNLTGIAATNLNTQTVTANGAATSIDLSAGNCITFNQTANTTVSFANTSDAQLITIIRNKDDNDTARTITWPNSIQWNGNSAPTLISDSQDGDSQQFSLLTRDGGATWYGWEPFNYDRGGYELYRWGTNSQGQLGLNQAEAQLNAASSPTQIGSGAEWVSGSFDSLSSHAIKLNGELWAWGRGDMGKLGLNNTTNVSSPTQVGTQTTWATHSNSTNYAFGFTKTDGTMWVMGRNQQGQLGQNSVTAWNDARSSPTQIPGTDWNTTQGSTFFTSQGDGGFIHIKGNGEMWVWGQNQNASLPINGVSPYGKSSPTLVPGTGWQGKAGKLGGTGNNSTFTIKTDGALWCWGNNDNGQLGLNNKTAYSSPKQVGTNTNWNYLLYGVGKGDTSNTMLATKTDGSLWCWGENENGILGLNEAESSERSSPVQLGSDTNWDKIQSGDLYVIATKTDGTLWGWGKNQYGQLGQNQNGPGNTNSLSSPTQIGSGTKWVQGFGGSAGLLNPNA